MLFDEFSYHDNEVLNIIEGMGVKVFYQNDKDWNYLKEERRWQSLNNESSWRKVELRNNNKRKSILHIR